MKKKSTKKKKAAKKKAAAKKRTVRKSPKKKTVKKKATSTKKKASRKSVSKKEGRKSSGKSAALKSASKKSAKKTKLTKRDRDRFRENLLSLRERLTGQVSALKNDSLRREDWVNSEEDGTDAFDRQFALNLVSSENDAIFEIDESLRRLDDGRYGSCEVCEEAIEKPRLQALPFVRTCIRCQSDIEKSRVRFRARMPV